MCKVGEDLTSTKKGYAKPVEQSVRQDRGVRSIGSVGLAIVNMIYYNIVSLTNCLGDLGTWL